MSGSWKGESSSHAGGGGPYLCFGSRGTSVEIAQDMRRRSDPAWRLLAYVDDVEPPGPHPFDEGEVIGFDDIATLDAAPVLVGIYDGAGRRKVMARLDAAGHPVLTVPGDPALMHPSSTVGRGSFVASFTHVGPQVTMGVGTMCVGEWVAHDVRAGDFVTIGLGARVLGWVHLDDDVLVGPGAVISNGTSSRPLRIGAGAVIGTGAVIDRDVPPGAVMVGNRAMPLATWRAQQAEAHQGRPT